MLYAALVTLSHTDRSNMQPCNLSAAIVPLVKKAFDSVDRDLHGTGYKRTKIPIQKYNDTNTSNFWCQTGLPDFSNIVQLQPLHQWPN